jgi:hypothetical protein
MQLLYANYTVVVFLMTSRTYPHVDKFFYFPYLLLCPLLANSDLRCPLELIHTLHSCSIINVNG